MIITDANWAEISESAGGLPDVARGEINDAMLSHLEDKDWLFEVRSSSAKADVGRALKRAEELSEVISALTQNEHYRCYNTGGEPVSVVALEQARESVVRLRERLAFDRDRFKRKSKRDRERIRTVNLLRRLLEIRHQYLNTGFPVEVEETRTSGQFRRYIELCTGLTGQRLTNVLQSLVAQFVREKKPTRRQSSVPERVSRKI
jgi:hypothetical protein